MPGQSEIFRAAATIVLIVVLVVAAAATSRLPPPLAADLPTVASAPDTFSAELRRCRAVRPNDAEEAHCEAVWEENRQRFFGRPARPLPLLSSPGTAAAATSSPGDAR